MCVEQFAPAANGLFDPKRCPLLQGLSPEDADRLMASDPRIRACRSAVETGTTADLDPCVAKMVAAHDARAPGGRGRRGGRVTPRGAAAR